jgi:uncharacterized protein (DUF4415 family)
VTKEDIRQASLHDIRKMKDDGLLVSKPTSTPAEDLGPEFWANARLVEPREPRSVHLKLDPEVFDYFKSMGKGHITRMQDVLRAYVNAHKPPGGR